MTKIHPEPVEIMAPNAEVPRVEAEASRNTETSKTTRTRVLQRPISREVLENLAYSVPKFDGKLEDWLIFRHFYMNRVHTVSAFTDTEKLLFLRHCVVGELGDQVARIGVSGANYSTAWAMIQGKFENKERELKARHMSLLLELPEMVEDSAESLFFLIENTRKHLQALRMLGVKIPHDFVVVSLAQKLDPLTQFEWKIAAKDREPMVEEMLDYLMRRLNFLVEIARIVEQKQQRGEEAAKCAFCNCPDHYLHQCFRFVDWSVEDRIKWVEDLGLCKKCFRDHYATQCKFRACYKCGEEHNILLHQDSPANAYPLAAINHRLANMHVNGVVDEGTSDEGISESDESESSQENEFQREQYLEPYDGVLRGHDGVITPEVTESKLQNGEILNHNGILSEAAATEEQSRVTHVAASQENGMYPAATVKEEQGREEDQTVAAPNDVYQENQDSEYHERTCQRDQNGAPSEAANQEEQTRNLQEGICQNGQNTVSLEAAQQEQNMGLHLGACHENQNLLPPEIDDDEDEQEITIICQEVQNMDLHRVVYQDPTYEPQDVCQQGGQNILLPGMVYQQAQYASPEAQYVASSEAQYVASSEAQYVASPEAQYIVSPEAQFIPAPEAQYVASPEVQYVAPTEVAYQVDAQNAMPHAMVYPQVQYVVSNDEAYQVVEEDIPLPEVVYQPMQYMCAHVPSYQVEGQIVVPQEMIYQPEQYVISTEEAYESDEEDLVVPAVVYQPIQYMEPEVVDQDQGIGPEALVYGVPYYATAQPLQAQQQPNILLPQPDVIQQQHAIQQQCALQQQRAIQQQQAIQHHHAIQQQHIIQQQHVIQQQEEVIRQQHAIQHHQAVQHQQALHQQQAMQHHHAVQHQQALHQQQAIHHILQQQEAARREQNRMQQQHIAHVQQQVQNPVHQEPNAAHQERIVPQQELNVPQQELNIPQQELNAPQQELNAPGQEENDANQVENDDVAGRLRADAEPFEPNRQPFVVPGPNGQLYIASNLNSDAQEFVPHREIQPCVEENESEIKR